jgi:hypothetical protein
MTDLLEQSSAWLDGQRKQFLAKLVTYCRTVTVPDPEDDLLPENWSKLNESPGRQ